MNIVERVTAPTPPFFSKLRNIGLLLTTICGALAATPVALPAIIIKIAGYVAVAAGVMSAVSQTAVSDSTASGQ